jgi:hypothetical protein
MRIIIVALLLVLSVGANAQRIVPIGNGRTTDTGLIVGSLKVDSVLVFPAYRTTNTNMVLGFDSRGKAVLRINNDSLIWATNAYVDSGLASISAGAVDTNNYISSITRLNREIDSVSNIIDSNNTIIYGNIATLQSDIVTIDSAVGVAFGAISTLYDTKADKDTLTNFLLKSDTATLSNRINLKQNYSDTTTWDATRYWVSTQIPSLAGYVPYTGATTDVDLGTHAISARTGVINKPSGSGTALSVTKGGSGEALTVTKSSGSGNAMSVTGGVTQLSELHTTTAIADAYIASAATWNAKGTVSSIQLVGGTNVTITPTTAITTSGTYTISATGGSSTLVKANEFNMLYKANGDTTIRGTTKVRIDTTDMRLEFAWDTTTSAVVNDYHGGVKMWGSNRMGMGAIRINDTVSIPAALQRAINTQITSTMLPTVTGNIAYTNNYVYGGMVQTAGTLGYIPAAWNSTIQHLNYNKTTFTTASGANSSSLIRIGSIALSAGIICGNTKFSGGGGRGTFTFSFPTYLSTQRIMIGYSEAVAALSGDPSTFLTAPTPYSSLMVIKDAADTTLQFAHYSGTGVVTKVNTGIKPNNEDVYRLTVYIAPNSTYYMQLEVISKTAAIRVVTLNPTTNVPPVGDRLVQQQAVNNGTVGGVVVYGLIQHLEEIY